VFFGYIKKGQVLIIMKTFEHMNFEKRKIIANEVTVRRSSAKTIAEILYCDPSAVSKELKRNRYMSRDVKLNKDPICKLTLRYPYVCNGCDKYNTCIKRQYRYEASRAQKVADYKLYTSRKGIDLSLDEFNALDKKIKDGIANNKSIYEIVSKDPDINVSVSTVYKYISDGILTTKRHNLPYAASFKKRKKKIKEYEYPTNTKIDRSNRTFIDYLCFKRDNLNVFIVQMDFLGSIRTDTKSILTLAIPEIHFCFISLIDKKNSSKMVDFFNQLENHIGIENFKRLFPCILTDRDPSFSDYIGIEFSNNTGELRTRLFYCDGYSISTINNHKRIYDGFL